MTQATAMTAKEMAALLTRAGRNKITEKSIREDIKAGAPNDNGKVSVLPYFAWLAQQEQRG